MFSSIYFRCYPVNTVLADPVELDRRIRAYFNKKLKIDSDNESVSSDDGSDSDSSSSDSSDYSSSSDVSFVFFKTNFRELFSIDSLIEFSIFCHNSNRTRTVQVIHRHLMTKTLNQTHRSI